MLLLTAINAKYIHSNLAVYDLKAYTTEYADKVEVAEYTINQNQQDILQNIFEKKPEIIAFSCYIWNIDYVMSLAADLKKVLPGSVIMLGGPEVSFDAISRLKKHEYIDIIIRGEGEKPLLSYLRWYYGGEGSLAEIKGLVYRDKAGIYQNDLNELMSMDEGIFPYQDIKELTNRIGYYETSRGCPFSCSYCLSSIEKKVRFRSLEKVKEELQFFLNERVPQVKFVDRTFNGNHEHAFAIWEFIGEHDNGITNFHFEIAADLLREGDFELFKCFRPGLIQLEIGVQSTNKKTLEAVCRQTNLEKLRSAVAKVHQMGNIHQHLDLIAGLPYEDYESFRKSFDEVFAMKPDQLQLGFLKVLKGSHMKEAEQEYELKYSQKPPYEVFSTKWISFEQLIRLKVVEEMVETFYNSGQFSASLRMLLSNYDSPFECFDKLGQFYKKSELWGRSSSRISRYNMLQEYFNANHLEAKDIFAQVLTYDYYLRENAKNRPVFAGGQTEEEKQYIRQFYLREAKEYNVLNGYEGYTSKQLEKMTKMLRFDLDIEHLLNTGRYKERQTYILFDYRCRSPLNHSARTVVL